MPERPRRRRGPMPFERRLRIVLSIVAVAGAAISAILLLRLPVNLALRICLGTLAALAWLALAASVHQAVTQPLRGLANVVEAIRAGDFSVRGRRAARGDALGDVVHEVNALARTLREERLRALEASALLDTLVARVDVAVLAVDGQGAVRLCNAAGARLLGRDAAAIVGRPAAALGLAPLLDGEPGTRIVSEAAGRAGRWQVTLGTFREAGLAQHLLLVGDVAPALREEERAAWRRLVRVIGHEVNNTLTPVKSLAGTLRDLVSGALGEGAPRADVLEGLRVIEARTDALGRFLSQYARLARLPAPRPSWTPLAPLLRRVAALEPARRVVARAADGFEAHVDADLLEQALINLVKNALEATQGGGSVAIVAEDAGGALRVEVVDDGPGIANLDNLFVPFFTTKPGGSGIGLALSRQIVEAHGGTLSLGNRADGPGAVATLEIPGAARVRAGGSAPAVG